MVSVCTVPARGGRSCERFGGYKTINRIPLVHLSQTLIELQLMITEYNYHSGHTQRSAISSFSYTLISLVNHAMIR